MAKWTVAPEQRRFNGPGPGGADATHGVNVYLRGLGGVKRKIAVWYAPLADESSVSPRSAVSSFLDDDDPPEHLIVTQGGVSVLHTD